ncbi:MAG: NADH-quinone oxidoreductase subunit J [Planctomycetota bacterium]|nr:NADH-quinone oxidoreductase subunit J [Planctomycetota bacterium]
MDEKKLQLAFYGALSLLSLLMLGFGLTAAGAEGLAFGLFTVMVLGGALMCIWERSVVRSAFALMATFSGIAGFFVLLESDFLAMAQILIYVGGILVLILFGVMLTPPDLTERKLVRVFSGLIAVGLVTAWLGMKVAKTARWAVQGAPGDGRTLSDAVLDSPPEEFIGSAKHIGVGFLDANGYVVPFELAAVLLTVALVASVYIARRKRVDLEPQPRGPS